MTRQTTNQLLELIEQEMLSKDTLILACLKYMSEDEVKDMALCNELIEDDFDYSKYGE
tara:strand:- start:149 stop:322 length:174 start_codon:yes stop_codon:yes gene_type:complete